MLSLLRLECKQKNYSNPSRIRIFLFLSYSFGIETVNTFIHYVVPLKPYPISDQNGQSLDSFSDQNGAKTLPNGAAHTSVYGLYKGVPPPLPPGLEDESEIQAPYKKINLIVLCDFEIPFMF